MRIAIVLFGTTGRGGMETVTSLLSTGFPARGIEARVFLLGGSRDMAWTAGLPIDVIGTATESRWRRYLRYVVEFPLAFWRYGPDLALCAEPKSTGFVADLVRLLRMKTRVVSWVHFSLSNLKNTHRLRKASLHFAISSPIAEEIEELTGHAGRVFTVFNPVETNVVPVPRPRLPTFLVLGRLQIGLQKRTDDLIAAVEKLRGDFLVRIVGDGPDRQALGDRVAAAGLAHRFEWLGWQTEPWKVAGAASCLVLTSAYEGFPMALVEGISRGLPIISTDCRAGPADVVREGENGWLVPVGDVEALAARMQAVIDKPDLLPSVETVVASARRFGIGPTIDRMLAALDPGQRGSPSP